MGTRTNGETCGQGDNGARCAKWPWNVTANTQALDVAVVKKRRPLDFRTRVLVYDAQCLDSMNKMYRLKGAPP